MAQAQSLLAYFPAENSIPEAYRLAPLHQREYLINGEIRHWEGPVQTVLSPVAVRTATDQVQPVEIGSYPLATEKEALEALEAAVTAYDHGRGQWPAASVEERIRAIQKFTFLMNERKVLIVSLLMWEIGKSLTDATKEFDRTVEYINATVDALKELDRQGARFVLESGIIGQIRRSPLGVVLCMGPFNYPLNETFTTLIPALIMGNTVLFKPPKHGTLLFQPLLEAFRQAFPKGVVNTIYGRGNTVVPPLMESGKVDVLALIGSSRVADQLKKLHPKTNRLRAILGLDAKNVAIVLPDADLDLAVKECVLGSLSYNGQRCTALKLLFVHRTLADAFLERFVAEVDKLKLGMPWEEGVAITPLPEPGKPGYLQECLNDALDQGARILNTGGGSMTGPLVKPAVVYPVKAGMKLYREEQFGPVVPIVPFDSIEEPVQYVIESDHGQQASVFGNDSNQVAELIDALVNQVSRVNLNSQCQRGPDTFPFTGRKDSAEGTLSVADALRSFSIRTLVAAKSTPENKHLINEILHEHKSGFLSTEFIL